MIRRAILSPGLIWPQDGDINVAPSPEAYAVATLIVAVGIKLNMDYGLNSSGASMADTKRCLEYLLYRDVNNYSYQNSHVRTMLYDRQKPTIVRGECYKNGKKGTSMEFRWMALSHKIYNNILS